MIELNKLNLRILAPWSLRDIHKLFSRVANIQKKPNKFIDIGIVENILFYTMSSVIKENEPRILDDIIDLLVKIFYKDDLDKNKTNLKRIYQSPANLHFTPTYIGDKKTSLVFLVKDKCKILYKSFNAPKDENEQKILSEKEENLKELNNLPRFLNSLFKMLLSSENEPILLSGNTSYKKELAKEFLDSASIISLNQEITINQLLGSSSFLSKDDSKAFYLKELCNCLMVNNLPDYMNNLNKWMEKEKLEEEEDKIEERNKLKNDIDELIKNIVNEKFPFKIAVNNLYNKLFNINNNQNDNLDDNNLLSDMVIEFRPGLILSAILGQRSLILGNLPNAKTVVLERFNELISGKHNLTLNEDIHETFTTEKDKELNNFINFRIIATCKQGYENRLSEALLSRFTVMSIEDYSEEEKNKILMIKTKGKKKLNEDDIKQLIKYSREFQDFFNIEFPLTKMVKCLDLYEKFTQTNNNVDLFFPFYILANGLLEKRDQINIGKLKSIKNDFEFPLNADLEIVEQNYLKSQFTNLKIFSSEIKIPEYKDEIFFSRKMKELINVLHTGLCTQTPIILEGFSEQGKSSAIKYLADYLNFELININISKETKVEDLLCQVSIEKDENGSIKIKNNETKLLKALKSHEKNPKSIIVFQNINNASPAILEALTSIYGPVNTNILLPNGDTFQKGEVHIFSIFNKQSGVTREKLPSSLIHNSLYYIVENPDDNDIRDITTTLFQYHHLEKEINKFQNYYFDSKEFISEKNNEISLSLSDIRKYILFRKKCPTVDDFIIIQFIFIYRFSKLNLIEECQKKLGLINLLFDPDLEYQNDAKNLVIKLIQGKKGSEINFPTFDNQLIKPDLEKIINTFNNITINGKYSLIFLICSVLTKRACILQGENCSGKTFLIRFFAKMCGRKLTEYQMNSNVGMSMFTRDSIINDSLSTQDKIKLSELIEKIKDKIDFDEEQNQDLKDLTVPEYKRIIQKINDKIKTIDKNEDDSFDLLVKVKKQISLIISPVNQIRYKESDFIKALREGEWVLIDGIESAPNQIIEKIISLCGDNPELNIFETGKGIYFRKEKSENAEKINENFHLFITCNTSKDSSKKIDQSLFSKCMTFTSPQIDSTVEDAALVLYSKINNDNDQDILINISSRLSKFHRYCSTESLRNPYDFAGRIPITPSYLLFMANIFNNSKNEPYENKIYSSLESYWKSVSNELIKEDFIKNSVAKFYEEPFELNVKKSLNDKLYNILLLITSAQQMIVKRDNKMQFDLSKFVNEIYNLKLVQTEIETVVKHIDETLNLNQKYNSHRVSGLINQMKIIKNILSGISEKFSDKRIDSQYFNLPLNSNEIEEIAQIKKQIKTLKLLKELIVNKNTYNQNIREYIFEKNFSKLLKLIHVFIQTNNTYNFKYLIEFLYENQKYIGILNNIFPYNNKKLNDFSKKFIWVICLLYKKNINFYITIDKAEFKFKIKKDKNSDDKLLPKFSLSYDNFYFDINSKIEFKKLGTKLKVNGGSPKGLGEDSSLVFLQMIENFSNMKNFSIKELNKAYDLISHNKNNISIPKEYFLLNNLFSTSERTSKISKVWALIFNFNNNQKIIEYLTIYLLPIESELIKLINNFFNKIEESDIKNTVELTNQLISFCEENSILWQDAIGKFVPIKSEMNNYLAQITLEINYFEKLKNKINIDLSSYIGKLNEIKVELNKGNEEAKKRVRIKDKINELKEKLNNYLDNRKYYRYHRVIQRMKTKILNSYEESEEYLSILENEVNDLLKYIEINNSKMEESKHIWPMPKNEKYSNTPEIILFKTLIWYSKIKQVIIEIKQEENIGIKKGLITKIEKYSEIKSIIDYLEFRLDDSNISIGVDDYNFIDSHLRNRFLLKLYEENESEDVINCDYLNFDKTINDLINRINTTENLYNYINSISNDYSTLDSNFNIYIPEFRPLDLIYLFMSKTSRGCKNDLLLKEYPGISIAKLEKLIDKNETDYIKLIIQITIILIHEKLTRDDIEIQPDYDYILNNYIKKNEDDFTKRLEFSMKIAKILNEKKLQKKVELNYDDLNDIFININKGYI